MTPMTTVVARPPARTVARHLLGEHLKAFVGFWLILILARSAVAFIAVHTFDAGTPWQWITPAPAKYFLLVLGIIGAAVSLPMYVAQGITRRDYGLGSLRLFGPAAVVFASLALAISGVEYVVYRDAGMDMALYPVTSFEDAVSMFLAASVGYLAWTCTGWLIGVAFYRFGAWVGIAMIPVASVPAAGTEFLLSAGAIGDTLVTRGGTERVSWGARILPVWNGSSSGIPWQLAVAASVVVVAVGLLGAYALVRDMPIKKVFG